MKGLDHAMEDFKKHYSKLSNEKPIMTALSTLIKVSPNANSIRATLLSNELFSRELK